MAEGSLTCSSGALLEEAVLASTWCGFPRFPGRLGMVTVGPDGKNGTGKPWFHLWFLDNWIDLMVKTMVSGVDFPQQTNPLTDFTGNHAVGCCLVFDTTSCFPRDLVSAAASTLMKSQSAVTDQDHGLQNCEVRRGKRNACPWSQWLLLLGPSLSEVGAFENGLSPAKCTRNRGKCW